MDNIWSSQLKTPWRAAHRHQISENDYENADIPNICEEVRGRLAGGGRGAGGVLRLGPATELLHGAALVLLDKTERALQDTFELSQKIMLKNYQNLPECWSSDDLEEESEDGDSEVERVPLFGKSSGNRKNDLEMSKSLRSNEVLETESDSGEEAAEATSSDELSNVSDGNEGNNFQDSRLEEEDAIEVEERAVQDRQCSEQGSRQGRGQCSELGEQGRGQGREQGEVFSGQGRGQASDQGKVGSGQGRGRCARGFDPRLRLGVMLIYEDCTQSVPSKIFVSSINPRTKL